MRCPHVLIASVILSLALTACHDAPTAGARCVRSVDCADGLECYEVEATGSRRCLAACDPAERVVCDPEVEGSGGLCAPLVDTGVCLAGGEVERGDECAASIDCAVGGVCVEDAGSARCQAACDTAVEGACAAGEACVAMSPDAPRRGYCAPSVDGGV